MIPSSPLAKLGAGVVAIVAVGAFVGAQFAAEEVQVEGGGEPVSASLGTSFADLAAVTVAPAEAPQPLTSETPAPVAAAEPLAPARPAEPPADWVMSETPPVSATTAAIALTPVSPGPEPAPPAAAEPVPPMTPPETIAAAEPEPAPEVVERSPRPAPRRERTEVAERPEPEPEPEPERPTPGATQSARAGSETGDRDAPASRTGPRAQRSSEAGNAAASNYHGEVMQRISRQRKPSVRARGTATVSFQVASSGRLAIVSIAGSSGSDRLDREAMRLIQRAAPFPPPPPGARRNFSIQISGR